MKIRDARIITYHAKKSAYKQYIMVFHGALMDIHIGSVYNGLFYRKKRSFVKTW